MYIEEVKEKEEDEGLYSDPCEGAVVVLNVKRVLVGAGARALFYPTLFYNVVRNKIQAEFRWWDRVDEFVLLGAVPFPGDVPHLKALGVAGVVTLNEPYETLVPTSLYHDYGIDHLVIPTRDYLFAPSFIDICQAVDFIHRNATLGKTTYVHCKAGRGRSTTIVLCFLVKHNLMTPEAAYDHVRSIRPRVSLASSQWQAVVDYYHRVKKVDDASLEKTTLIVSSERGPPTPTPTFDDDSLVLVTESDLVGYDEDHEYAADVGNSSNNNKNMLAELNLAACRVQFASQAAIARLSWLWLRCNAGPKSSGKKMEAQNQMESIRVY